MTLADVRDYIAALNLSEHVYMGKLPDKEEKSIGVYNSKHQYLQHTALGGPDQEGSTPEAWPPGPPCPPPISID